MSAVRWAFPKHDYKWLVEETEANLPLELDFAHEAANTERCRANFASSRCAPAYRNRRSCMCLHSPPERSNT